MTADELRADLEARMEDVSNEILAVAPAQDDFNQDVLYVAYTCDDGHGHILIHAPIRTIGKLFMASGLRIGAMDENGVRPIDEDFFERIPEDACELIPAENAPIALAHVPFEVLAHATRNHADQSLCMFLDACFSNLLAHKGASKPPNPEMN